MVGRMAKAVIYNVVVVAGIVVLLPRAIYWGGKLADKAEFEIKKYADNKKNGIQDVKYKKA